MFRCNAAIKFAFLCICKFKLEKWKVREKTHKHKMMTPKTYQGNDYHLFFSFSTPYSNTQNVQLAHGQFVTINKNVKWFFITVFEHKHLIDKLDIINSHGARY